MCQEAITGVDLFTEEKLTNTERIGRGIAVLLPYARKALSKIVKGYKSFKTLINAMDEVCATRG